jgi:hypothetical protein
LTQDMTRYPINKRDDTWCERSARWTDFLFGCENYMNAVAFGSFQTSRRLWSTCINSFEVGVLCTGVCILEAPFVLVFDAISLVECK